MWAPGLRQLDGSQGSQCLWPPSVGTPGVRGQWRKGRAGVLATSTVASLCLTRLWEEEGCVVFPASPSLIAIQLCQGANRVLRVPVWFHSFIPSAYKMSLSNVPKPTVRGKCFVKAQQFSAFTEAAILSEPGPLQHWGLTSGGPFVPSTPHPPVPLSLSWILILCHLQNTPRRIVAGEFRGTASPFRGWGREREREVLAVSTGGGEDGVATG